MSSHIFPSDHSFDLHSSMTSSKQPTADGYPSGNTPPTTPSFQHDPVARRTPPSTPKVLHKEIEKRRRNRMKAYFEELEEIIPNIVLKNSEKRRKLDKIAVLSETNNYTRHLKGDVDHNFLTDDDFLKYMKLAGPAFHFIVDPTDMQVLYVDAHISEITGHCAERMKQTAQTVGIGLDFLVSNDNDRHLLVDFIRHCVRPMHLVYNVMNETLDSVRFNTRTRRLIQSPLATGSSHSPTTPKTIPTSTGTSTGRFDFKQELPETPQMNHGSTIPTKFRSINLNQECAIRFDRFEDNPDILKPNCYCCAGEHALLTVSGRVCQLEDVMELNPKNGSQFINQLWLRQGSDYNLSNISQADLFIGMARVTCTDEFTRPYIDQTKTISDTELLSLISLTADLNFMSIDQQLSEVNPLLNETSLVDKPLSCILTGTTADAVYGTIRNAIAEKTEHSIIRLVLKNQPNETLTCGLQLIINPYDNACQVVIIKMPV